MKAEILLKRKTFYVLYVERDVKKSINEKKEGLNLKEYKEISNNQKYIYQKVPEEKGDREKGNKYITSVIPIEYLRVH